MQVIMQEQSQLPAFPLDSPFFESFAQSVSKLQSFIAKRGGKAVLLMTWGYKGGDGDGYSSMQHRLTQGYLKAAKQGGTLPLIPAGLGWRTVHAREPRADFFALYDNGGNHPSLAGSCLAAGITLRYLFGVRPELEKCLSRGMTGSTLSAEFATRLEADIAQLEPSKCVY